MKIADALQNITKIVYPDTSARVVKNSATTLAEFITASPPKIKPVKSINRGEKNFIIALASAKILKELKLKVPAKCKQKFIYLQIQNNGTGICIASHSYYLYSFVNHLIFQMAGREIETVKDGKWIIPSFNWQRVSYDYFLTQQGRIQYKLNRETYINELARLGFTHIEVNGLAFPMGLETGPRGETYPMFYTYCPALDQFVSSKLNKGLYPDYYLSANLEFLKKNAAIAGEYGLVPGLLCFEPRSVPEAFFSTYPMLRGARVDHPFRSFKPRYNMTITHPRVLDHYAEMVTKLMNEVPELEFINIWTNDSGAGFEHTKSLYVGRNGGAYLIREWKDDKEISRLAGENALRFLRNLKDAGRTLNPKFKVITRMESFYGEHETIWNGLEDGIDLETASLVARGWDIPYRHPRYPDSKSINAGTIYQTGYKKQETVLAKELNRKGSNAHFYFSAGQHSLFDPLMGIPYPFLVHRRLKRLHDEGIDNLSLMGGNAVPELVPFNINHEVLRTYQYNPDLKITPLVKEIAKRWAGKELGSVLVNAWKLTEEAILAFPNVSSLYTTFGFTWYRLWARPLVPDIEKIPQEQRNYYENFMCTTPHNPNNVDLSKDVLFLLSTPEKSQCDLERIDENVWEPVNKAIDLLEQNVSKNMEQKQNIIYDQLIRIKALKYWMMTQRNIAAWISGVYGYMAAKNKTRKNRYKSLIVDMIQKEIENTKSLSLLLDSGVEFMAMTDKGETPLIYGKNLKDLLKIRIQLMKKHMNDEPFIDHNYTERIAGHRITE